MKAAAAILCLSVVMVFGAGRHDPGDCHIISLELEPYGRKLARKFDLDPLMEKAGRIYCVAGTVELIKLREKSIRFRYERSGIPGERAFSAAAGVDGDFHSYSEVEAELAELAESYPDIVRLHVLGRTLEGRNITAVHISDFPGEWEDEPEVLLLGCHHAREWISVEVPLLAARRLAELYETEANVRALVDGSGIWVVPLVNPDGLEYSIHVYRYWRKNRRDNGGGSYGVDPNRNYGFKWGCDDIGSSPDPDSFVYRGSAPFSELETQAVRDLIADRAFSALLSYHNYSQAILFPWGYTENPAQERELLNELAAEMAARIRSVNGRDYTVGQSGADLYFTNGDTADWALAEYGIPSFTVELPPPDIASGGFFNSEQDIPPIFEENWASILYLIDWSIKNHVPGDRNREPGKPSRPREIRGAIRR